MTTQYVKLKYIEILLLTNVGHGNIDKVDMQYGDIPSHLNKIYKANSVFPSQDEERNNMFEFVLLQLMIAQHYKLHKHMEKMMVEDDQG